MFSGVTPPLRVSPRSHSAGPRTPGRPGVRSAPPRLSPVAPLPVAGGARAAARGGAALAGPGRGPALASVGAPGAVFGRPAAPPHDKGALPRVLVRREAPPRAFDQPPPAPADGAGERQA